ncbi:Gustatory and pheromone receptor 32a [Frankliniella fusca]|uniref:Gustatory and pheromone receptor 32a n=1 Tax=Frankliniella fusca TaxID=407009 RepID=A0AAE1GSX1_9NEOP|nr:Gustatory and pheromone receptor 32a [Frankliniella fusca]
MQETRFGALNLIHFDMSTMTAILASFTTYLAVLNQFSAIIQATKKGSLLT